MAPKEADFYLGTGEVTYLPEVGRRMVYILLCQGRLLWRSSEKARGRGDFEGEQRGDGSPTFCSHLGQTECRSCVYLCLPSGSVLISQETTDARRHVPLELRRTKFQAR